MLSPFFRTTVHRIAAVGASMLMSACAEQPAASVPNDPGPARPVVEYVARQEILTPLPLRVRLPAKYGAERVLVFFHTWGSKDWGMVELARSGQAWSGAVSCREVSTVTGDTRYFFLALDGEGSAVVGSGSPEWPHVATIVGSLPGGPEALAGEQTPLRCHDPADCPPDFIGCPAYAFVRPPCQSHDDCGDGDRCAWDGYCSGQEPPLGRHGSDQQLAAAVRAAMRRYKSAALQR
jgi:hypothetical protein